MALTLTEIAQFTHNHHRCASEVSEAEEKNWKGANDEEQWSWNASSPDKESKTEDSQQQHCGAKIDKSYLIIYIFLTKNWALKACPRSPRPCSSM